MFGVEAVGQLGGGRTGVVSMCRGGFDGGTDEKKLTIWVTLDEVDCEMMVQAL